MSAPVSARIFDSIDNLKVFPLCFSSAWGSTAGQVIDHYTYANDVINVVGPYISCAVPYEHLFIAQTSF
jgi:hypothetical protein